MSKWSLSEHITTSLMRERLGNMRPPALWPSEASAIIDSPLGESIISGACRRSTYFRYIANQYQYDPIKNSLYKTLVTNLEANKEPTDKYMNWVWAAGNSFEDFVVEHAKQSGVFIEAQTQVVIPEINLVGKLDLIVIDPLTNCLNGIEIKSVHGYNAKDVLGTEANKRKGLMGTPRDSNLMQAALYEWHLKKTIPGFLCRLFYGARDTGTFAEYIVSTEVEGTETAIYYQGIAPVLSKKIKSNITIENIINQYKFIDHCYINGVIPTRDYNISYTQEYIEKLYSADLLSKTNSEAFEKIKERKEENIKLIEAGCKPKKELKELEMGDWRCENCSWRTTCYDLEKKPRTLTV